MPCSCRLVAFGLLLLVSTQISLAALSGLAPEDVSTLLPLPRGEESLSELRSLLGPNDTGGFGKLIPKHIQDQLPQFNPLFRGRPIVNKVVSFRLDPCFPSPDGCQPQIRLIFQPLDEEALPNRDGDVNVQAAAVHTFYKVEAQELRNLVRDLLALRKKHGIPLGDPNFLGVHAGLREAGLKSTYFAEMKRLILRSIGERRLIRVTFNALRGQIIWAFGGFELENGKWKAKSIKNVHRVSTDRQRREFGMVTSVNMPLQVIAIAPSTTRLPTGKLIEGPIPHGDGDHLESLFEFLQSSAHPRVEHAQEFVPIIHRLENPELNNPTTTDCMSCHLAFPLRAWAERTFRNANFDDRDRFRSSVRLDPRAVGLTRGLKSTERIDFIFAFAYFDSSPQIIPRTLHETELVVKAFKSATEF